jgi:hypothetical protein
VARPHYPLKADIVLGEKALSPVCLSIVVECLPGRLDGNFGDVPPAELEEAYPAENRREKVLAEHTTLGFL